MPSRRTADRSEPIARLTRAAGPIPEAVPGPPPHPRMRRCYVLDEDPSLGASLPANLRAVARQLATAAVVRLAPGSHPIQEWYSEPLHGPGLLMLHGVVAREVRVAGRTATELLGPGDVLRPWDTERGDPVESEIAWRVLTDVEFALLDADFAGRTRLWPELAGELIGRAVHRAQSLAIQRAIASHPRVDMRVAMVLWHLAARWGKVQADGRVRLPLPLTHRLIGELVGAERPPVSNALGRLTRAGLVARSEDGWVLCGTPEEAAEAATRPLPPH